MKNTLIKDTFREIRRTLSRFLSIFAIVAIGVSFFAGVKATCPDMKITADKYFDDYRFMDIRLLSTMGFNDKDIDAIRKVSGIEGIYPGYSLDALVKIKNKDMVLKAISFPLDKIKTDDPSYINRVRLVEGRYPENPGECLSERGKIYGSSMDVGSKIKLFSGTEKSMDESLKRDEFTVVGIVETPYYLSFERGTSAIGNGKVNSFLLIPEENFKPSIYTEVYLTVKGSRELFSYGEEYDSLVDPVQGALEDTGKVRSKERYEEVITESRLKIDDSKRELRKAEDKQRKELEAASSKLRNSERKIVQGEKTLKKKEAETRLALNSGEDKLASGYVRLQKGEEEYEGQLELFKESKEQAEVKFQESEKQIEAGQSEIDKKQVEIDCAKIVLATNPNLSAVERDQMEAMILAGEQELAISRTKLEASRSELEEGKKQLLEGEAKLEKTRQTLDASRRQLDYEKAKLQAEKKKAEAGFETAHKKLYKSRLELEKIKKDFEKGKNESDDKIAEGYARIADGERDIGKIEEPVWYVLDRNMHADFVGYGSAADRIDAIAEVFPVFFFLVAALVCLTTMTRMVDEQRINIGTLKALGYSRLSIASKYLMYAALASLGGSIFGVLVGFRVFPIVISNAYGIMYTLPPVVTDFNVTYAVISTVFAVLSTTVAAWFACYKELMVEPAELMRPRAPKAGKRIFLERIKFLWSRLNFTQKVTARNIFRYKKRLLMTVLGIGGCTALLLSGFGLKDSIVSIASKQFDELYRYDMVIDLKKEIPSRDSISLLDSRISDYILVRQLSVDAGSGKNERSATLYVPENRSKLQSFILFRDRTTGEGVPFRERGVVLTEKLARMLQVSEGDEIYIKKGDTRRIALKVSGITENYVSHFIYMPPELYKSLYGEDIKFRQIVGRATDTSEEFENKLSSDMLKNEDISSVSFTTGISSNFKDIIGSLNYVILVLIISAGALAFVVLYNLTNINVTERLREIATIKVLGFYDGEVSAYVYRENIILTLIGMALGLVLGVFLHKFIVVTAEVDYVMFGRNINLPSYFYSGVLTVFFSGLVNFAMYFKLRRIRMVESLKSVD